MARYTGPVCRLCRRLGDKLYLKGEKCFTPEVPVREAALSARAALDTPAQGLRPRPAAAREAARPRDLRHPGEAVPQVLRGGRPKRHGVTGENLLRTLELRLDNVVYRLGLADSRPQARQIVLHGHIAVNGRKSAIPSHVLKPNDVTKPHEPREQDASISRLSVSRLASKSIPSWLSLDVANMTAGS